MLLFCFSWGKGLYTWMIIIFLKLLFHLFQYIGVLEEFGYTLFFVVVLFLVGDAVFHGSPEVHGDGAKLDFYRIVFVCIQTADIYAENDMVAAVTVGLGVLTLVALTDENKVGLLL